MTQPTMNVLDYSFPRYLAAKRSVDDRALNRNVWDVLAAALAARRQTLDRPLRVLEAAAGIGTMLQRALDWGLFDAQPTLVDSAVEYTALDAAAANIAAAEQRLADLPAWCSLRLQTADIFDFCDRAEERERYDLLIAHAFLDLLDLPTALPRLRRLLRPGGLFYFTINFDGATILQPTIDAAFDARIERAYHHTMDERVTDGRRSGDSRAGRHLFGLLPAAGYQIEAAGSSDWVVHPLGGNGGGGYPADEAYFLHFIIHTMHGALCDDPAVAQPAEALSFEEWIAARHAQIERGELVYIAHQLDFMGHI